MSVKVRARAIVIAAKLDAVHLQADVTTVAIVVEGVLPTISTTGEMAALLVIVNLHRLSACRTTNADVC